MKKAKLLRIGMTSQEVLEIMGDPKSNGSSYVNILGADSRYRYQAPFGSSEGVVITFDKAKKVIHDANE